MENPAPFDLNQALSQWRATLQNLGGLGAEELEELEGHLRESISVLHARGISVHEAFMIATRRLGSEQRLADEFAKANPQRTWIERAMWMAAGVLLALMLAAVIAPFSNVVLNCALWSGLNEHLMGALHILTRWVSWVGAAAIAYWVFSRHSSRLEGVVQACIRRPVLSGLGLFLALQGLQYGMRYVNRLAEPLFIFFGGHHPPVSHPNASIINTWVFWGYLLTQVLWIAAVPLLAGYAWRKRWRLASEAPDPYELQPGEHEAARMLQAQGLSLEEAALLLGRRHCQREAIAPSVVLATNRGIWPERAAWMVIGVAVSHCLDLVVWNPGWLLLLATRSAAPIYQHLAGFAAAGLGLALAGAIIIGLWRWVTRHPSRSTLSGTNWRGRPVLTALALVAVCAGAGLCEYALSMYLTKRMGLQTQGGFGPIASEWITWSSALIHLIIPIALLLWLARRWQSAQIKALP